MAPIPSDTTTPLLEATGIRKSYGAIHALLDANISVGPGECVGLVGDNGAGKSTFVKTLAGAVRPDAGTVRILGNAVTLTDPGVSRSHGVETVYQDLSLCEHLTVARNLFLGRELRNRFTRALADKEMEERAERHLAELGIHSVKGHDGVSNLSGGQRQCVAVAKALAFDPKVLILDEPTSALGVREVELVLDLIRRVTARGVGVVLITHRLQDLYEVCDRFVVMFDGRDIANAPMSETPLARLVELIDGRVA